MGFSTPRTPTPQLVILLAGLVVLAGCNTIAGHGGSDAGPTVTPAPVPTEATSHTPTVTVAVDGDEIDDMTGIITGHENILAASGSYTRLVELRVLLENGTIVEQACETAFVNRSTDRYHIIGTPWLAASPFSNLVYGLPQSGSTTSTYQLAFERYTTTWNEHIRWRFLNGSTNLEQTARTSKPEHPNYTKLLASPDLDVQRGIHERSPWFTSIAGRYDQPPVFRSVTQPHTGQIRVVVRGGGLIEHITMIYDGNWSEQPATIVLDIQYRRVGTTTVGQPKWLEPTAIQNPSMKTYIPRSVEQLAIPEPTAINTSSPSNPVAQQRPECDVLHSAAS